MQRIPRHFARVRPMRFMAMSSTVPTVPVIATRLDELNPAFEVAQSIVRNMTDMQLTKLLHVHCGGAFLDHFGQARYLDVTGCSNEESRVSEAKEMKQYTDAELVDYSKPLPFRTRAFQFITCLQPMDSTRFSVDINELSRVLSAQGCALLGCSTEVWEGDKLLEQLQVLDDDKFIELLMVQQLGIRPPDEFGQDYTMCLFRATC